MYTAFASATADGGSDNLDTSVLEGHWLKMAFLLIIFLFFTTPKGWKMYGLICKVPNSLQNSVSKFPHSMGCLCLRDFRKGDQECLKCLV